MPKRPLRRKNRPKLQLRVELLERRDQPGSMLMVLSEGLMPFKRGAVPEPLPDRLNSVYEVSSQVHHGTNKSPSVGSKSSTVQTIEFTQSNAEATTGTFGSNFNSKLSHLSSSKGLPTLLNNSNVDAPSSSGFGQFSAGGMPEFVIFATVWAYSRATFVCCSAERGKLATVCFRWSKLGRLWWCRWEFSFSGR